MTDPSSGFHGGTRGGTDGHCLNLCQKKLLQSVATAAFVKLCDKKGLGLANFRSKGAV